MIKTVSGCVSCVYGDMSGGCDGCSVKSQVVAECDRCDDEYGEYFYDGEVLCSDCLFDIWKTEVKCIDDEDIICADDLSDEMYEEYQAFETECYDNLRAEIEIYQEGDGYYEC